MMENAVADALSLHMLTNDLFSPFQWAYKRGLSSELLLVNMTEQWRIALDANNVVCAVFFDFKKAFDSIDHAVLLNMLNKIGISDNVRFWLTDYFTDRAQFTVVNGTTSSTQHVTYGVLQGSVLGPILFSIFCNDLPNIATEDDNLYMYADDTTIFTIGLTMDIAVNKMHIILHRMFHWCIENRRTAHPHKCEYMILRRSSFVGPMAAVRFGTSSIKQVSHTRCLVVELDDRLSCLRM